MKFSGGWVGRTFPEDIGIFLPAGVIPKLCKNSGFYIVAPILATLPAGNPALKELFLFPAPVVIDK